MQGARVDGCEGVLAQPASQALLAGSEHCPGVSVFDHDSELPEHLVGVIERASGFWCEVLAFDRKFQANLSFGRFGLAVTQFCDNRRLRHASPRLAQTDREDRSSIGNFFDISKISMATANAV